MIFCFYFCYLNDIIYKVTLNYGMFFSVIPVKTGIQEIKDGSRSRHNFLMSKASLENGSALVVQRDDRGGGFPPEFITIKIVTCI
jgi:hypothetical protein